MRFREFSPLPWFGRKKSALERTKVPLLEALQTRDRLTRGLLSLFALCHDKAYSGLDEPNLEWPHGLQPVRSFNVRTDTKGVPRKIREILEVEELTTETELTFGGQWEIGSGNAMLFLKNKEGEGVLVLGAQLKPDENQLQLRMTHFSTSQLSPKNLTLPQGALKSLFSKTAVLALKCVEKEHQKR